MSRNMCKLRHKVRNGHFYFNVNHENKLSKDDIQNIEDKNAKIAQKIGDLERVFYECGIEDSSVNWKLP